MAQLIEEVRRNLDEVRRRIRTGGGDPERITIVAVTKGFGPETVEAALEAGLTDIGENYPAELAAKADVLEPATVHFLGGVQRRQVRSIAPLVDLWHSVDRAEEGEAVAAETPGARVLVQVDIDPPGDRAGRAGIASQEVPALVTHLQSLELEVAGLMAVGPRPPADPRPGFREVGALAQGLSLPVVSLGMSGDLEAAVAAGSTMVRVGTALFGPRPPRKSKTGSDGPRKVG